MNVTKKIALLGKHAIVHFHTEICFLVTKIYLPKNSVHMNKP